jgi:hypothetical protein
MSHIVRIKRSETPGAVPDRLAYGELAYNFTDHVLYIGTRDGTAVPINATGLPLPEQTPAPAAHTTTDVKRRLLRFDE